jgi:hypothetical protein
LDEFQGDHNVVALSGLNPPPAHRNIIETASIDGVEVETAHYRGAVYQAVMRYTAQDANMSSVS